MEEYYDTNREEGAEAMDVEGMDRPMGEISHHDGPTDGAIESGMSVCTADGNGDNGVGGDTNLDHDQRQRSSGRVVKPRVVYLAEIEASQQLRGNAEGGGKGPRNKGQGQQGQGQGFDQGVFGIQVIIFRFVFFFTFLTFLLMS